MAAAFGWQLFLLLNRQMNVMIINRKNVNMNIARRMIFDMSGRYYLYTEFRNDDKILVDSGYYLYHDGIIQIDEYSPYITGFRVEEENGEISLNCFGYTDIEGYWGNWQAEDLITGTGQGINGKNYLFTADGIPTNGETSADKLWEQHRYSVYLETKYVFPAGSQNN